MYKENKWELDHESGIATLKYKRKEVIIDIADYRMAKQFRWVVYNGRFPYVRAYSHLTDDGTQKNVYLKRLVLGMDEDDRRCVVHKDGNCFNLRRNNLALTGRGLWKAEESTHNISIDPGVLNGETKEEQQATSTQSAGNGKPL